MTQDTLASGVTPIAIIFATGMTFVNRTRSGINWCVEKLGSGGFWMEKNDLISRAAAIDALGERPYNWTDSEAEIAEVCAWESHKSAIENINTVDAVPVVHARWQGVSPFVDSEECSVCRYCIQEKEFETPYCPWCGAKMDGEWRNDDETSDD